MTFRSFEEISAWQSARKLVAAIYRVSKEGEFARDFGLWNQIRRAALSVMANIAEGFSYRSGKEFAKVLLIGKASALEVQSHLYAALDQWYLTAIEFRPLYFLAAGGAKQPRSLNSVFLHRQ